MKRKEILAAITLATALLSGMAFAQAPKTKEDSAHHPSSTAPAAGAPALGATPSPEAFNMQMKAMQDMRQKLQAAKTPAECAKLMEDHMKLMQSGLAMLGQMRGSNAGMTAMSGMSGMMNMHMQMERRLAMMEQMMQMMVDREAVRPRK